MVSVKTASVSYERKLNLGDYNSAAIGCTLWADVEPGDDLDAAMKSLWAMAKENVRAQAIPLTAKANGNMKIEETYLGLPLFAKPEEVNKEK
mgnify:CR=1 FL=1